MRRHRILQDELIPVVRAVHLRLETLLGIGLGVSGEGASLSKELRRFKEHRSGPSWYPPVTRGSVSQLLNEALEILESVDIP